MTVEPTATYRVQLHAGFGFDAAAGIADYLAALGVSHLYCAPYLQAAPGSRHGYDVVDPTRVNGELGGAAGHQRLLEALERHALGQILDIVPNHMAIGSENPWWWNVLENGPSSPYASYFDVDWDPPEERLRNVILVPILADHFGRILEAGEIRLERADATFLVCYEDHAFPISPRTLDGLLSSAAARSGSDTLAFLADAFGRLPRAGVLDRESRQRRHRDHGVLTELLGRLLAAEPAVTAAVDETIAAWNRDPDALDALLERQNYRLAFWRAASRDLGYRRFFDINTLVALRTEDEAVFDGTHALILQWLRDGQLDGLRIDHIDGLRRPEEYLRRLRNAAPGAWIIVEKILGSGERLPDSWPVAGTTGYDFLNEAGGLLVDPEGEQPLTDFYVEFTGESVDAASLVREKKLLVLKDALAPDVARLADLWLRICERHRRHRDYSRHDLTEALREVAAAFPVYRTYVGEETESEAGVRHVHDALDRANAVRADLDPSLFAFLGDLLLLRVPGDLERELAMRVQQLTGPAMAKGVEDTVFYCLNRLTCLNEVGADPGRFGTTVDEFHRHCAWTARHRPQTLVATSSHDTKRSEDVRARIALVSEIPGRFAEAVRAWSALNECRRRDGMPDRNAEYLLYQTLIGAWPIEVDRVAAFMEKAAREAKVHTTWTQPDEAYEERLRSFVRGALADPDFTAAVERFVAPLVEPGRVNSLALTLLKLTAPGVPDLYQGTELWDLSLVDPDNRRPVDYARRRQLLAALDGATPETLWSRSDEGLPKLWVIRQALRLRRQLPHLFGCDGGYEPLIAQGAKAGLVVGFVRGGGAATIVPRLPLGLGGEWGDTAVTLPAGRWRNVLTGDTMHGGTIDVKTLLGRFPVALLARPA